MRISDWSSDVCSSDLQRFGDHRRVQHLIHRHRLLQMRLGIFRAIGVALDRNMRHRALEVVLADAVDAAVRARKLGEIARRSEEHTSELQSLMRISYAGFCLKKKK